MLRYLYYYAGWAEDIRQCHLVHGISDAAIFYGKALNGMGQRYKELSVDCD